MLCAFACPLASGCGGAAAQAPTEQDAVAVGAAVSDIVFQCQSVAAGFIASPDSGLLRHDVDALLRTYHRVRPSAPIVIGSTNGSPVTTNLRRELALAAANLAPASCAPQQARRLQSALGH
jgi:hypothetical protein